MRVWTYPDREWAELGAVRYQVSWEQVKPQAKGKEDIDPDCDLDYMVANYKTKAAAVRKAKQVVDGYLTAYGAATVTKQVVDWYVEEDRIAEWADTSEHEEVS